MITRKSISFILIMALVFSVFPATYSVDKKSEVSAASAYGEVPVSTFDELKNAVENAEEGDVIKIASDNAITFTTTISFTASVSIIGESAADTVLIGPAGGSHFNYTGMPEIIMEDLTVKGPGVTGGGIRAHKIAMTNCIVSDNIFEGGSGNTFGGGVFSNNDASFTRCTIKDNQLSGDYVFGGGVSVFIGDGVFNDCTFTGNISSGNRTRGGALSVFQGEAIIKNCTISNNKAIGNSSKGGGVYTEGGGSLEDSVIARNQAVATTVQAGTTAVGGGINSEDYTTSKATTLVNCVISENKVSSPSGGHGGGVYIKNVAILTDCAVTGNEVVAAEHAWAGGVSGYNQGAYLYNCTVSDNKLSGAREVGGGILSFGNVALKNCTVTNNSGGYGGAVNATTVSAISSTILNNTGATGSGISCINAEIRYSVISDNISGGNDVYTSTGALRSQFYQMDNGRYLGDRIPEKETTFPDTICEYSIIGEPSGYSLTDTFGSSYPKPADNGGLTMTVKPADKLKMIPVDSVRYLPKTDQRGILRPTAGYAFIGSVEEFSSPQSPSTDTDPKTSIDNVTKIYTPNKKIYLKKGKTIVLPVKANATNNANPKLIWSTSNKRIATVTKSGKVKAKKAGTAKITVKANNGKKLTFTVKVVKKDKKVKKFTVKGYKKTMKKGQNKYITVKLNPQSATNGKITFKSSNKKVLTVDKAGKITAKKKGKAKVTIKSGGKKKVVTIKVKDK